MAVYNLSSDSKEVLRDFVHHPGWRILIGEIRRLEGKMDNLVVADAWDKPLDVIRRSAGQRAGVQEAIKFLDWIEQSAAKNP